MKCEPLQLVILILLILVYSFIAMSDKDLVGTGIYVGYFCGIVLLSIVCDRLGTFDNFVKELGESTHTAFMKYEYHKHNESATVHDTYLENFDDPMDGCCGFSSTKVTPGVDVPYDSESDSDSDSESGSGMGQSLSVSSRWLRWLLTWIYGREHCEPQYNLFFVRKLAVDAHYWGCADGVVTLCGDSRGIIGDFVFRLCNNHSLFSIFLASKRSRFARQDRRRAFIVQTCVTFFLEALVGDAISGSSGNYYVSSFLFNFFIVSPVALLVNHSYFYLLTCPCLKRRYDWCYCQFLADCGYVMGRVFAFPFLLGSLYLLYAASSFTDDYFGTLITYVYQVHVMSVLEDLWRLSLAYRYERYTRYEVLGYPVFSFGNWFREQCEVFDLKEEKHYVEVVRGWSWLRRVQWFRRAGVVRPRPEEDIEHGGHHHHHHHHKHHSKSDTLSPEGSVATLHGKADEVSKARSTRVAGVAYGSAMPSQSFYQKRMSALNKANQAPPRSNSTSPAPG